MKEDKQEDTYNKLRRVPFEQLFENRSMMRFRAVATLGGRVPIPQDLRSKMAAGNWTEAEFLKELESIIHNSEIKVEVVQNQEIVMSFKDVDGIDSGERNWRSFLSGK